MNRFASAEMPSQMDAGLAAEDVGPQRLAATAAERRLAGQEQVSDDADGPDVALVVVVAANHLRGDRVRRADGLVVHLAVREMLGQPEVDELL